MNRARWMGGTACLIVALDCFEKSGGELQLPYWAWAVLGVVWALHGLTILFAPPPPATCLQP